MELSNCPTDTLLQELHSRATHGVAAIVSPEGQRVDVWWGDRVTCLGLATRLAWSVQQDLDQMEALDEVEDEPADESEPLPQINQYGNYL